MGCTSACIDVIKKFVFGWLYEIMSKMSETDGV